MYKVAYDGTLMDNGVYAFYIYLHINNKKEIVKDSKGVTITYKTIKQAQGEATKLNAKLGKK